MTDEQPAGTGRMSLDDAGRQLAGLAHGMAYTYGAPETLRVLLSTAIGFALLALPKAHVAAWLRQTADELDALKQPRGH